MVDTLKYMASNLNRELNALGMDYTQVNVFRYLIDPALPFLAHKDGLLLFFFNGVCRLFRYYEYYQKYEG